MIIYSHTPSPRLQYVVDFLAQYYHVGIRIICDEDKYTAHPDPHKINYSFHRLLPDEIWIHSHALLFESTIRPVKVEVFEHRHYKAFFRAEGDTGFDLPAAVFYLLTRYEEYLPHQKDLYGRFAHRASLAFKEGFLHLPLVNIWLEDFKKLLQQKFAGIQLSTAGYQFLPTYDIDMAWSFRHKGFTRNSAALLKLFVTGKWRQMAHRIAVIRGRQQDPFDAYEWMNALHRQYGLHPVYFFLVAGQKGRLDKNIDPENRSFQKLIKELAASYQTGLHPSWASGDEPALLSKEKAWLEKTAERPVTSSRQHYIRFNLPATYRRLLAAGIINDYSMGYGSVNGFRASVASPFYWYDLKEEVKTALRIHPFCFMDANSYYEEKKSATEAFDEMKHYQQIVRSVNGTLITIWHNNFLGTDPSFKGWREVYEAFTREG